MPTPDTTKKGATVRVNVALYSSVDQEPDPVYHTLFISVASKLWVPAGVVLYDPQTCVFYSRYIRAKGPGLTRYVHPQGQCYMYEIVAAVLPRLLVQMIVDPQNISGTYKVTL